MEVKKIRYAINIDDKKRVQRITYEKYKDEKSIVTDTIPEGNASDYKYIDGSYVYDPLPKPEPQPKPDPSPTELTAYATYDELAAAIREGVNSYGK